MSDDTRPKWTFDAPEEEVRWLAKGMINEIKHHWEMTGVDTADDWITLHREGDSRRFRSSFLNSGLFQFKPNWRELVVPTYEGERAIKKIEEIDQWEKRNARDRADFERLKAKFGAGVET